jgi:hypothetical protein
MDCPTHGAVEARAKGAPHTLNSHREGIQPVGTMAGHRAFNGNNVHEPWNDLVQRNSAWVWKGPWRPPLIRNEGRARMLEGLICAFSKQI